MTEQGAILTRKGNRLVLFLRGERMATVRVKQLNQVVLWGQVRLSPGTIRLLLEHGIDTVFLSRRGRFYGRLVGMTSKNAPLRKAQWEAVHDREFSLKIARQLVTAKIHNCRTLLRNLNKRRRDPRIQQALHGLRNILNKLPEAGDTVTLMGYEGEAANTYFQALGSVMDDPFFQFEKRTRRPPRDATNALLSFTYTLVLSLVYRWVEIVGMDPHFGFLHDPGYGKPSLCLDLMEPFRPALADAFVVDCIQRNRIKKDDFDIQNDRVQSIYRLTPDGLKKYVAMWEHRRESDVTDPLTGHRITWTGLIERQVRRMARAIREYRPEVFEPYRWF